MQNRDMRTLQKKQKTYLSKAVLMMTSIVCVSFFPLSVHAETTEDGYEGTISGSEFRITAYNGTASDVTVPAIVTIDDIPYTTAIYTTGSGLFQNHTEIVSISFDDGVNIVNSPAMFSGCTNLVTVDLGYCYCENLDVSQWFLGCASLQSVNISELDTSRIYNAEAMFKDCVSLSSVTFSEEGFGNVSGGCREMFSGCTNLTSVSLGNQTIVSSADTTDMFYNCRSILTLDLSRIDMNGKGLADVYKIDGKTYTDVPAIIAPVGLSTDCSINVGAHQCYVGEDGEYYVSLPQSIASTMMLTYKDSCKITYELDGGENSAANPETLTAEEGAVTLADATKAGAIFEGWFSNNDFTQQITEIPADQLEDMTVYAKFELINYDITYHLDQGENDPANPSTYNVESEIELNPAEKEGYELEGWYLDENFSAKIEKIAPGQTGNLDLYAKWVPVEYKITYHLANGTNASANPDTYTIETQDFVFEDPIKEGGTFVGWYDDEQLTHQITGIPKGSTGDKDIYAKWKLARYSITYMLDGGTNSRSNVASYNVDSDFEFGTPFRKGYTFTGWYTNEALTAEISGITTGMMEDLQVYAGWELNEYSIQYVLCNGQNHPDNPDTYTVLDLVTLEKPEREGFVFDGWSADGFNSYIERIEAGNAGDMVFYAKWHPISYSVSYKGNGSTKGNIKTRENWKYGGEYTLSTCRFEKEGYDFDGWNTKADGSGTHYKDKAKVRNLTTKDGDTVILYAQWIKK